MQSQLPYALIQRRNPWFDYQVRTLKRRGRKLLELPEVDLFGWGCLAPVVLAFFGCCASLLLSVTGGPDGFAFNALINLGSIVSLGLSILCEVYYAVLAINGLRLEFGPANLDLVRISLLRERDIVYAFWAVTQLRAWRAMVLEIGARFTVTIIVMVVSAISLFFSGFDLDYALILVILSVLSLAIILEPLWRMRSTTSLALAIALRVSNVTSAYLVTVLAFLAGLVALFGLFALEGYILLRIYTQSIHPTQFDTYQAELRLFVFAVITGVITLYSFFKVIQVLSLWWATRRLRLGV